MEGTGAIWFRFQGCRKDLARCSKFVLKFVLSAAGTLARAQRRLPRGPRVWNISSCSPTSCPQLPWQAFRQISSHIPSKNSPHLPQSPQTHCPGPNRTDSLMQSRSGPVISFESNVWDPLKSPKLFRDESCLAFLMQGGLMLILKRSERALRMSEFLRIPKP